MVPKKLSDNPKGRWVGVACIAFIGAYVALEAYYAGQRDGASELVNSVDPSSDDDKSDPAPKSQPDAEE